MTRQYLWLVTYLVKYSELRRADECNWIEDEREIVAPNAHMARAMARDLLRLAPRTIRGQHISTRRVVRF